MGTLLILIILVVVIAFAVVASVGHMKGEGGCCGGGGEISPQKKKLDGKKIGTKIITVDGMHCEKCKFNVEHSINKIDGAVANVKLKKNIAVVSMSRNVSDEELTKAVESVGFKVVKIETGEK